MAEVRLFAAIFIATTILVACSDSDDNIVREGLTLNGITLTSVTVSSLTFTWETVDNAVQYGYRLLDADGNVVEGCGGVTAGTTASFTGLDDDTEYTFEVTSFSKYNGDYSNGEAKAINVKTDKIVPLDTPDPEGEVKNEKVTVTWAAIENADKYYVKVTGSDGSEVNETITDATTTSYSFTGTIGLTYSVSVSADTEAEAYSQSEWGTVKGLVPVKAATYELWRVEGDFYDAGEYQTTSKRTLIAYSDGTYKLLDWIYTGSGYDLEFNTKDNGEIEVINGGTPYGSYIPVEYYSGYSCYVYTSDGYSSFDETEGSLTFYASGYYQGTSTFTWNPNDVVVAERWRVTGTFDDKAVYGQAFTRTLVAYADGTYKLLDWIYEGSGCDLQFSVNTDGTLNILNGTYDSASGYYGVEYYPGGYSCSIYPWNTAYGAYSTFETDATDGTFWFYAVYGNKYGYSQFSWKLADVVNAE